MVLLFSSLLPRRSRHLRLMIIKYYLLKYYVLISLKYNMQRNCEQSRDIFLECKKGYKYVFPLVSFPSETYTFDCNLTLWWSFSFTESSIMTHTQVWKVISQRKIKRKLGFIRAECYWHPLVSPGPLSLYFIDKPEREYISSGSCIIKAFNELTGENIYFWSS